MFTYLPLSSTFVKMYNYVIEPLVLQKFRPLPNLMVKFLIALMPLTEFLQGTEESFLSGFCDKNRVFYFKLQTVLFKNQLRGNYNRFAFSYVHMIRLVILNFVVK